MKRIMSFWEKDAVAVKAMKNQIPYLSKQLLFAERQNSFSKSENKTHVCVDFWRKPHQSFMKNEGIVKSISILLMWSVTEVHT